MNVAISILDFVFYNDGLIEILVMILVGATALIRFIYAQQKRHEEREAKQYQAPQVEQPGSIASKIKRVPIEHQGNYGTTTTNSTPQKSKKKPYVPPKPTIQTSYTPTFVDEPLSAIYEKPVEEMARNKVIIDVKNNLRQGIIMAEILGPCKARR